MIGSKPFIKTRDELKGYIRRKLGDGVIVQEITEEQLDDCINDTLQEFIPYSFDGAELRYLLIDLTSGQYDVVMPYNCLSVISINETNNLDYSPSTTDLFSVNQHVAIDILKGGMGKVDLLTLEMSQQQIATLGVMFNNRISFDYNSISKLLHVHGIGSDREIRAYIEYYKCTDIDEDLDAVDSTGGAKPVYTNIFDVKWVKQFATELARRQWADNLIKYEGSTLPNGLQLNPAGIAARADAEIERLRLQLHEEYELPVDFFIG